MTSLTSLMMTISTSPLASIFPTFVRESDKTGLGVWLKWCFLWLLELMYNITEALNTPSWVLAILLFTIVVRLALQPLMNKQLRSSRKMQLLQPEMEELKRRYGSNPQKLNMETSRLYKENGASPTAGCLPLLVQMPIIIVLFNAIRTYAPTDPESLAHFCLPMLGYDSLSMLVNEVGAPMSWVLPLAAGGATFLQQWFTTANHSDRTQMMMLIMMPVMFVWMVFKFPAMVALYWVFYTLISFIIQYPLMRRWEKQDKAEIEAKRAAKDAEEEARRERKAAARAAKQEARRSQKKAGYEAQEDDFDEEEGEKPETDLDPDVQFRQWVERQGWTIRRKKMRLHPYSIEDEVVELIVRPNGAEVDMADARAQWQRSVQRQQAAEQAAMMKDSLGLGFGKKKKKQAEAEQQDKPQE